MIEINWLFVGVMMLVSMVVSFVLGYEIRASSLRLVVENRRQCKSAILRYASSAVRDLAVHEIPGSTGENMDVLLEEHRKLYQDLWERGYGLWDGKSFK